MEAISKISNLNKNVLVVILNWNNAKDTLVCIKSLRSSDASNARILVVDNGSNNEDLTLLKSGFKGEILQLSVNQGFAGGMNASIKTHRSPVWVFLNNDTTVNKTFLEPLLQTLNNLGNLAIVSPLVFKGEKVKPLNVWFGSSRINWWIGRPVAETTIPKSTIKIPYASGCCFLTSQEVLDNIKGFRELFFAYFEDTDLGLRAKKKGIDSYLNPNSIIYHKVSASTGIYHPFRHYYFTRNRLFFMRIYGRWYHWPSFILIQVVFRSLFDLRRLFHKCGFEYYLSFLKGTLHGLHYNIPKEILY